jgi:hypothetical protein
MRYYLQQVPIVSGTLPIGASLAMDFSMADGSPVPHNINYVHSWLKDSVAAQHKISDNIVDFFASDFGGALSAFRLMIPCAVRRSGFL